MALWSRIESAGSQQFLRCLRTLTSRKSMCRVVSEIMLRYRIARAGLVLLGIFFAIGALNIPSILKASKGPTDYFFGTLLGHAIFIVLAVFCFRGYKRIGVKMEKEKTTKFKLTTFKRSGLRAENCATAYQRELVRSLIRLTRVLTR